MGVTKHVRTATVAALLLSSGTATLTTAQQRPLRRVSIPALVTAIAFAPDGKSLTVWDPSGLSRWDAQRGRNTTRETVFRKTCGRSAVIPRSDDGIVVGANCRGRLVLFETATGRPVGEWQPREGRIAASFAASRDGSRLAAVMAGALTAIELPKSPDVQLLKGEQEVERLAFSSSGRELAASTVTGIQLWELPAGQLRRTIPGGPAFAFRPDGRIIAVPSDGGVALVDLVSGELTATLQGSIAQLRFSPDGKSLVGWTNQQAVVWDIASRSQRVVLTADDEFVTAAISPDGTQLATINLERRGEGSASILAIWRLP